MNTVSVRCVKLTRRQRIRLIWLLLRHGVFDLEAEYEKVTYSEV